MRLLSAKAFSCPESSCKCIWKLRRRRRFSSVNRWWYAWQGRRSNGRRALALYRGTSYEYVWPMAAHAGASRSASTQLIVVFGFGLVKALRGLARMRQPVIVEFQVSNRETRVGGLAGICREFAAQF